MKKLSGDEKSVIRKYKLLYNVRYSHLNFLSNKPLRAIDAPLDVFGTDYESVSIEYAREPVIVDTATGLVINIRNGKSIELRYCCRLANERVVFTSEEEVLLYHPSDGGVWVDGKYRKFKTGKAPKNFILTSYYVNGTKKSAIGAHIVSLHSNNGELIASGRLLTHYSKYPMKNLHFGEIPVLDPNIPKNLTRATRVETDLHGYTGAILLSKERGLVAIEHDPPLKIATSPKLKFNSADMRKSEVYIIDEQVYVGRLYSY